MRHVVMAILSVWHERRRADWKETSWRDCIIGERMTAWLLYGSTNEHESETVEL